MATVSRCLIDDDVLFRRSQCLGMHGDSGSFEYDVTVSVADPDD